MWLRDESKSIPGERTALAEAYTSQGMLIGGTKRTGMGRVKAKDGHGAKEDVRIATGVPRGTLIILCLCMRTVGDP